MRRLVAFFAFSFLFIPVLMVQAQTPVLKMAVFGNSISRGVNCVSFNENIEYNWATGTKIDSHMRKLEQQRNIKVVAKNLAISGVTSNGLKTELKNMKNFVPDYVVIEIGANDLCRGSGRKIVKNVKVLIDKLIKINPNIEINLIPIIKITSVHDAGFGAKCELAWNIECPFILGALVSDEKRFLIQLQIDGINYSLQELASFYPQVYFNPGLGSMDISYEDLGVDCFHPSVTGQQKIADMTFNYNN